MTAALVIRDARVETWEDHVEAWHHFGRVVDGAAWGRAAVAASLNRSYGEGAIEKFAAEVGQSRAMVFRLVQVHEAFPEKSTRVDSLSFKHHFEALYAPDPRAALGGAEREGWSVRELREHIRQQKALVTGEPEQEFHSLIESGRFRDAAEALARKHVEHWPEKYRPLIPEMLRALADELEDEFRAR